MVFAEGHATRDDGSGERAVVGDPSMSSALEHLVASSQGAITKRIDLAMLEGRQLITHTLQGAILVGLSMVMGAGAWFAVAACLALIAVPNGSLTARLAIFGALNAGGAVGLVALARHGWLHADLRHEERIQST